ncbi:MAG: hypothetical protein FWD45_04335, partial [Coriobacteriia bacterium]|nr:hypothetical protein [Coriobacteriia bacterium]
MLTCGLPRSNFAFAIFFSFLKPLPFPGFLPCPNKGGNAYFVLLFSKTTFTKYLGASLPLAQKRWFLW